MAFLSHDISKENKLARELQRIQRNTGRRKLKKLKGID
jgi:hypothetical protein